MISPELEKPAFCCTPGLPNACSIFMARRDRSTCINLEPPRLLNGSGLQGETQARRQNRRGGNSTPQQNRTSRSTSERTFRSAHVLVPIWPVPAPDECGARAVPGAWWDKHWSNSGRVSSRNRAHLKQHTSSIPGQAVSKFGQLQAQLCPAQSPNLADSGPSLIDSGPTVLSSVVELGSKFVDVGDKLAEFVRSRSQIGRNRPKFVREKATSPMLVDFVPNLGTSGPTPTEVDAFRPHLANAAQSDLLADTARVPPGFSPCVAGCPSGVPRATTTSRGGGPKTPLGAGCPSFLPTTQGGIDGVCGRSKGKWLNTGKRELCAPYKRPEPSSCHRNDCLDKARERNVPYGTYASPAPTHTIVRPRKRRGTNEARKPSGRTPFCFSSAVTDLIYANASNDNLHSASPSTSKHTHTHTNAHADTVRHAKDRAHVMSIRDRSVWGA